MMDSGQNNQDNFLLYTSTNGDTQVDVRLENETVWLPQKAMAELFSVGVPAVNKHLRNIFNSGELKESATVSKMEIVRSEGKRDVVRQVDFYNLDAIISVGYRVNSKRAVQFRQWATGVLRQYLVQGYSLNQRRLQERGIEFEQALLLLSQTLTNQQLVSGAGPEILRVVTDYARTWTLLQSFDEQTLESVTEKQLTMRGLELEHVLLAISELKKELIQKGEATDLFGKIRGEGLYSAIATIEQTFGGEALYPMWQVGPHIYFILPSKIMRWWMGIKGRDLFCFCGI